MEKALLNALLSHNMEKVCQEMILPSRDFTGGSYPYTVDLNADAVIAEDFLVRIDSWMNNMLEFDGVTDQINRYIYMHDNETNEYVFDYVMVEELQSIGYDLDVQYQGYTYNDPDSCRLSRDIHYTVFKFNGDYYTIFSIHYGADARSGLGDIACFKVRDLEYFHLGMVITAYIESEERDYEWYEIEDIAEYDKEKDAWVHNETGEEIDLNTPANGF